MVRLTERILETDRIYLDCVIDMEFCASARGPIVLGPARAKGSTGVSSPAVPFHLSIVYERFICRVHDFARARLSCRNETTGSFRLPQERVPVATKENESRYTQELNMIEQKLIDLCVPIVRRKAPSSRPFPRRALLAKYTGDGTEYGGERQEPQVPSRLAECRGTRRR